MKYLIITFFAYLIAGCLYIPRSKLALMIDAQLIVAAMDNAPRWRLHIAKLVLYSLAILFWPLAFLCRESKSKCDQINPYVAKAQERAKRYGEGKTYLDNEHGWGRYNCKECGFIENITASVHLDVSGPPGEPPGSVIRRGAQCQKCGMITEIDNLDKSQKYICECSGTITNSNPLFCQKCRSTNVRFQTTGMT